MNNIDEMREVLEIEAERIAESRVESTIREAIDHSVQLVKEILKIRPEHYRQGFVVISGYEQLIKFDTTRGEFLMQLDNFITDLWISEP